MFVFSFLSPSVIGTSTLTQAAGSYMVGGGALRSMAETKKKMPFLGVEIDVTDVPITQSEEHFNKYTLEDGTVLRVKSVPTSIMRVEGQFLPDGSPIYIVLATPVYSVEAHTVREARRDGETN